MTFAQFQEGASTLPNGVLPILNIAVEGSTIVVDQSVAILRYIGKLDGKLYPTNDPLLALHIDRMMDVAEDIASLISMTLVPIRGPVALCLAEEGSPTWTPEEVVAIRKRMMDSTKAGKKNIAFLLHKLEDHLAHVSTSGYLVGGTVTIADLRVHQLVSWFASGILDGIDATEFMTSYPKLIALKDLVEALEPVQAYRSKYGGDSYDDFDYTP
jgi:glutathione S-transferase